MTAVVVGRFDVGSADWHAARAGGLGGSEIAAVLGLSPYASPYKLHAQKAGLIEPDEESEIMEAGTALEPVIVGKFQQRHPEWFVDAAGLTYHHVDRPWQIANPDALIYLDRGARARNSPFALLECKLALYPDEWGTPGTDEIPVWYLTQVRWYLDVMGLDLAYVMVFFGSMGRFVEYIVRADLDDQAFMVERAEQFLAAVAAGQWPSIDASSHTYDVVRALHPQIEDRHVDVPDGLAMRYLLGRQAIDSAEMAKQKATNELADLMGTAREAKYQGRTIARRQARGGGTPYVQAAKTPSPKRPIREVKTT